MSSSGFTVYFAQTSNLGFQSTDANWVIINIASGNLNSSDGRINVYTGGGYFKFTSNETFTFSPSYQGDVIVKVAGDNNNPMRTVANQSSIPVTAADYVEIVWSVSIEPYLPIIFLFGMVGLGSMFTGVLWPIALAKEKKYYEAGIKFVTFFFIGLGLFMAWVFL